MKLLLVFFVAIGWQAQASYVGSVSSATAEAGRASVEPTDSPFMNPAALPFLKGYFFTSGFSTTNDSTERHGEGLGVSIIDNMPDTVVPTAVSFSQTKTNFASNETSDRDFRLSLGNYLAPHWSLGLGFKYLENQAELERFNQMNLNIGTLYAPNADLGFAAVFENVISPRNNLPAVYRLSPTTGLGLSYIYRRYVRTRVDLISGANNSWQRPTLAMGLESYMNRWIIIRIGVQRRNEEQANAYSAGLGFAGPKFGIHYAYFKSPELESLTRHSIDLMIPIW